MDTNGEKEGAGAYAGDGQPGLLNDGEEGRASTGAVPVEEAPEGNRAESGGGAVGEEGLANPSSETSVPMANIAGDPADWEVFEAAARRPIEQHIPNSFIKTYKAHPG